MDLRSSRIIAPVLDMGKCDSVYAHVFQLLWAASIKLGAVEAVITVALERQLSDIEFVTSTVVSGTQRS